MCIRDRLISYIKNNHIETPSNQQIQLNVKQNDFKINPNDSKINPNYCKINPNTLINVNINVEQTLKQIENNESSNDYLTPDNFFGMIYY